MKRIFKNGTDLELAEHLKIVEIGKQLEEEGFAWSEEKPGFSLKRRKVTGRNLIHKFEGY